MKRRTWVILLGMLVLLAVIACIGIVIGSANEIASPHRRQVMDYHRDYLEYSFIHGMRIDAFAAVDGTPCLLCTPVGSPGERGKLIRRQLEERGIALAPFGEIQGTLVLVHGRKGRKEDYLPIAERLCAAGFRCVIPDMPAHGDHPVNVATYGIREADIPERVLHEASTRFGFSKQPVGLLGMSMGGSVAIHSAARENAPWKALVVISSFDSFPSAIEYQATRHVGRVLGSVWADATGYIYQRKIGISLDEIQPHRHAANIKIPTLMAHGTDDRIIAMESGQRLFQSIPQGNLKAWIEIPDAGHDNVLITNYPIYSEIAAWMLRHVAE